VEKSELIYDPTGQSGDSYDLNEGYKLRPTTRGNEAACRWKSTGFQKTGVFAEKKEAGTTRKVSAASIEFMTLTVTRRQQRPRQRN
jgi:hypothetical protein